MNKIKLTQGKFALVDDENYEGLNKFKWYANKKGKTFYAVRKEKGTSRKDFSLFMHRVIMDAPIGLQTDHKNRNGLDNQKNNLRICTISENQHNQGRPKHNSSGYKGVYWNKRAKKWRTQIRTNNKLIHLGYFFVKETAYKAYCEAVKKYHGEFAGIDKPNI